MLALFWMSLLALGGSGVQPWRPAAPLRELWSFDTGG